MQILAVDPPKEVLAENGLETFKNFLRAEILPIFTRSTRRLEDVQVGGTFSPQITAHRRGDTTHHMVIAIPEGIRWKERGCHQVDMTGWNRASIWRINSLYSYQVHTARLSAEKLGS